MALISKSIPNLINGVSQQPPSLRLPSQAEEQLNGLSSVVSGLSKRPGTEHLAWLPTTLNADTLFMHTIRRDENEVYHLMAASGVLKVFDKNGVEKTISDPSGAIASYLGGLSDPSTQLTATTVADFTFLCNKTKTVEVSTTLTASRPYEALFYLKQSAYGTTYTITVTVSGTTYTGAFSTPDGSVATQSPQIKTDYIMEQVFNALTLPASVSKTLIGNVIYVYSNTTDFTITSKDGKGDTHLFAFKGTAKNVADLPPKGPSGFKIKVVGDADANQDDFWVEFRQEGNSLAVWQETVAPGIADGVKASTMPHQLRKNVDGSFTFEPATWSKREVGDDNTNSMPSFVGATINDIFFHKNRLGFLSDENVIFSEAGSYYNFFQPTVVTSVDSAPIDVAVSNNQVSILKHAIPFNEALLMFSDLTQFALRSEQLLTPNTAAIDVLTQYETSTRAKPVAAGKFVFFPIKKGIWSGVREYFVEEGSDTLAASNEVTSHVPTYLPGQVRKMASSSNEDMLLVLTEDDPNACYVYRWYWQGREKVVSSWSRWTFGGKVMNVEFNNSQIFLIVRYTTGNPSNPTHRLALESINLSTDSAKGLTTKKHSVHLDRRVLLTPSSTAVPYSGTVSYVSMDGGTLTAAQATAAVAAGQSVYAGTPFLFKYVFSEQVMMSDNKPVTIGRLQIRNFNVIYNDTGYFKAVVKPVLRDTSESVFTGRLVGGTSNTLGTVSIDTGTYKFPVLCRAEDVEVSLESESHLPCYFQSAEWEGFFALRSRRM